MSCYLLLTWWSCANNTWVAVASAMVDPGDNIPLGISCYPLPLHLQQDSWGDQWRVTLLVSDPLTNFPQVGELTIVWAPKYSDSSLTPHTHYNLHHLPCPVVRPSNHDITCGSRVPWGSCPFVTGVPLLPPPPPTRGAGTWWPRAARLPWASLEHNACAHTPHISTRNAEISRHVNSNRHFTVNHLADSSTWLVKNTAMPG